MLSHEEPRFANHSEFLFRIPEVSSDTLGSGSRSSHGVDSCSQLSTYPTEQKFPLLASKSTDDVSIWDRLPLEILEDIFLMCLPFRKDQVPSNRDAPYLLISVCRAWYKVVAELPRMWTIIVLNRVDETAIPPDQQQAGVDHLKLCFVRSRTAPMALYIRAEFIANLMVSDYILSNSERVSHLTVIYPYPFDNDHRPWFPASTSHHFPNLETFEVRNRHNFSRISEPDLRHFDHIIQSSKVLRRNVVWDKTPKPSGPQILPNTTNLQILSLIELIPMSTCFFILQSIPTLEKLSIKVTEENTRGSRGMQPSATVGEHLYRPFVHQRLRNLTLAHHRTDPSTFFQNATLPPLQFLIIDFLLIRTRLPFPWPHSYFTSFIRRSGCRLKSFHILDQQIASSQLLEILRLPHLADSLQYLGIQAYGGSQMVIDDVLLEQLTLASVLSRDDLSTLPNPNCSKLAPTTVHPRPLCPNLERLILFAPLEFSLSKLLALFESRLPIGTSPRKALLFRTLKHVEMDVYDEMKSSYESLQEKGLVLTLFDPALSIPMPPNEKQLLIWRNYLAEGLDDEVYDYDTGTWRPADMTLAVE